METLDNKVNLTDDELSLITTSLQMTLLGHERYLQVNGEESIDFQTKETIKGMKELFERLDKEYY